MKPRLSAGEDVAACGAAIEAFDAAGPRKRLLLLKIGLNVGRDGRKWMVEDQAHASAIVAATKARAGGQQLPIDYDHQSVFGAQPGVGGQAPAAGWMTDFDADEQGVWASADWTGPAEQRLRDREYRYVSPFFGFTPDGKVTRIFNAGLTNNPNFELPAVASVSFQPEHEDLKLQTSLIALLGLQATATEDQILAAVTEQKASASAVDHLKAIATAAGLAEGTEGAAVASAVTARLTEEPDPTKYAPKSVVDSLVAQVNQLQGSVSEDKATAAVDLAVKEGKLAPALAESWAKPYALKDLAGFIAWASAAPVILKPGESAAAVGSVDDTGEPILTAEQRAACAVSGVSEADYAQALKEERQ